MRAHSAVLAVPPGPDGIPMIAIAGTAHRGGGGEMTMGWCRY